MFSEMQKKFAYCRKQMGDSLVEREEETNLLLASVVCKEHTFLCGDPGTAKSLIVETIARFIKGAKKPLTIHCCKDSTRDSCFGPIDVLKYTKEGKLERRLEGGAADADFLILEEVFKAGPAVLDMFLMLMNERVLREGLIQVNAPLRTILGVGNEWSPEGCEAGLAAFFDRFLFRKLVNKVSLSGRQELLQRAELNDDCKANFNANQRISISELDTVYQEAMTMPVSGNARLVLGEILNELDKEGVTYGDRRLTKVFKAVRAYAYVLGKDEVEAEDMEILSHVLWNDPGEQREKCGRIVNKLANPVKTQVNSLLLQARDVVMKNNNPNEILDALTNIENQLKVMQQTDFCKSAISYVQEEVKQARLRLIGAKGAR